MLKLIDNEIENLKSDIFSQVGHEELVDNFENVETDYRVHLGCLIFEHFEGNPYIGFEFNSAVSMVTLLVISNLLLIKNFMEEKFYNVDSRIVNSLEEEIINNLDTLYSTEEEAFIKLMENLNPETDVIKKGEELYEEIIFA